MAATDRCAAHPEKVLAPRRNSASRKTELVCVKCGSVPAKTIMSDSVTRQVNTGAAVPAAVKSAVQGKRERQMAEQERALATIEPGEIGRYIPTAAEVARAEKIVAAIPGYASGGGDLTGVEKFRIGWTFMRLSEMGLDARHCNIIHGSFYINVDGYTAILRKAEGKQFGQWTKRLATSEEKEMAMAYSASAKENDVFIRVGYERYFGVHDGKPVFTEVGSAVGRGSPTASKQPVEKENPGRMAEIRAKRQICRELTGGIGAIGATLEVAEAIVEGVEDIRVEDAPEQVEASAEDKPAANADGSKQETVKDDASHQETDPSSAQAEGGKPKAKAEGDSPDLDPEDLPF